MTPPSKRVSVIIPAYNADAFIKEAVLSVYHQSHPPGEIIVVDDGSTDDTCKIVEQLPVPVTLIKQVNQGASAARNRGIENSQFPLIAFLDADDLWLPAKLQLQMLSLEAPNIDVVFGHIVEFNDNDRSSKGEAIPGFSPITMLARREVFSKVGPFSTNYSLGEFIDWWARAKEKGIREILLPSVVAKRRIHRANTGIARSASRQDYAKIVAATLQRRRRKTG